MVGYNLETMTQPIKVRSRFATAYDTARVLGVSSSRTRQLIAAAKKYATRVAHRDEETPATAVRKNRRRNADATKLKANSKTTKSHG
jgi:hypothetical protein